MSFRTAALTACALVASTVISIPAASATGTTDVWTGGGDGSSWSDSLNWSTGHAPLAGDSVSIAPPSKDQCHAHVVGAPQLALTDLILAENALVGSVCEASVTGAGFTVAGTLTWNGGQLDAPTTLLPSSTGTITPVVDDISELSQDLTVEGTLTLNGNTYDGSHDPDRSVELQAGSSLTVAANGVLQAHGTNVVEATSCCTDPARIINNGTLRDTGSLTLDNVELDQNAVLDVDSSTDEVVSLGAPNTAGAGAQYQGAGDYRVTEASARDTLSGRQTLGPDFRFILGGNAATSRSDADGNESLHGTFAFAGTGEVDWVGGELAANLTIGAGVRTRADANVIGGNDDSREITDRDQPLDGSAGQPAALTNHGALGFTGAAAVAFSGNARMVNAHDGTMSLAAGTSFTGDCCVTQGAVLNEGGSVDIPTGSHKTAVSFNGVGYSATGGHTTIGSGQTLSLIGGANTTLAATALDGGTLKIADPVRLSKTVTVSKTSVRLTHGASLEDAYKSGKARPGATLAGSGSLTWAAGTLRGLLTVHLAHVSITGAAEKYVAGTSNNDSGSHVIINAPLDVSAGADDADNADVVQIENNSTLEMDAAATLHANVVIFGGHIVNKGKLTVVAGTGKRVYDTGGGSFTNAGTVDVATGTFAIDNDFVQSAGRTVIATGAALREIGSSSSARLAGGTLTGAGTIFGDTVVGAATVRPTGFGTLTVHGDFLDHSNSVLAASLARTQHSLLSVTGTVSLAGRVAVHNSYQPRSGDRPVAVHAGGQLTATKLCVTTSGTGSTGSGAHHWVPVISKHQVVLRWVVGRRTSC